MARTLSPESLVTLLAETLGQTDGAPIMAADGDGTLWEGDIGEDLFELALDERLLKADATEPLLAEARAHDVRIEPTIADDPNRIGEALLLAHRAGTYPNAPAFAMMAWAFAGFSVAELDALSEQALDERGFDARVRAELEPMRAWADGVGVPLWLVSASPDCVARAAARRMGIERVVAMMPAIEAGIVQPALGLEATYRDGKIHRLRGETDAPLLAGFGDSYWDLALMEGAAIAVAVAPNTLLRARIGELDNGYVLEADAP